MAGNILIQFKTRSKDKICVGDTFGRWEALGPLIKTTSRGRPYIVCRCTCPAGVVKPVDAYHLAYGNTLGCRECRCKLDRTYHGLHDSPEYRVYIGMIHRCTDPKTSSYADYGGRGIKVCKRWREGNDGRDGVLCFFEDVGPRPSDKHTLDRVDNEGNYSCGKCCECLQKKWPLNCRWANWIEQARNRRSTLWVTAFGRTQTLMDWAAEKGMSVTALRQRIAKGWDVEQALTEKVTHGPRVGRLKHGGRIAP